MIELALVGCPSSGKSTFFKASTLKDAKIASYPFTTLAPDEGLAYASAKCPCIELNLNCKKCINGIRFVPIKLWDIAGLVPDAHLGRGRGIAFLDDVRQANALIQIIDISGTTDLEGNPTNDFDPSLSIEMLEKEITYWMLDIFKRDFTRAQHIIAKDFLLLLENRFTGLGIGKNHINKSISSAGLDIEKFKSWTEDQCYAFVNELRKISKPSIVIANKIDISSKNIENIKSKYPDKIIIPASADIELALREAAKHEIIEYVPGSSDFRLLKTGIDEKRMKAIDYMKSFLKKHKSTGIQEAINSTAFDILGLIVVYPVADPNKFADNKGNILPDAFLLKKGSTAHDLAYAVHEDIGKKFIAAADARTKRNISADYVLKNGDVISIKSGK
ncbi:MAG: redox-regulated ATPase YchF [Candidatus Aenigmarchaeota archaeon]|nr:redox-regulated ATPase YchF [Candidatus Aenigmarchaeota archaeon]